MFSHKLGHECLWPGPWYRMCGSNFTAVMPWCCMVIPAAHTAVLNLVSADWTTSHRSIAPASTWARKALKYVHLKSAQKATAARHKGTRNSTSHTHSLQELTNKKNIWKPQSPCALTSSQGNYDKLDDISTGETRQHYSLQEAENKLKPA